MKKTIVSLFLSVFCCVAFPKTVIYTINGINGNLVSAADNLAAFAARYCEINQNDCKNGEVDFRFIFNPSEPFFIDYGELNVQSAFELVALLKANGRVKSLMPEKYKDDPFSYAEGSDEYNLFVSSARYFLAEVYGNIKNVQWFKDIEAEKFSSLKGFDKAWSEVFNALMADDELNVLLIPHSQGNYLAQAVKSRMEKKDFEEYSDRLGVLGIGSVSSLSQYANEHVTHSADRALDVHEALNYFSVNPNFDSGWPPLGSNPASDDRLNVHPLDYSNHALVGVYMGMRKVALPDENKHCVDRMIPAERYVEIFDSFAEATGKKCKWLGLGVSNTDPLIGVGDRFIDLRGRVLYQYIIERAKQAIPARKMKLTEIEPSQATVGRPTIFTIKGKNLPANAQLHFTPQASCDQPQEVQSDGTGFKQTCTLQTTGVHSAGVYAGPYGVGTLIGSKPITAVQSTAKATALAPAVVNRDESTLFTVIGQNLPTTAGIVFGGSENRCGNAVSMTPAGSGFKQACRIQSSGDTKVATIIDSATSEVLGRFQVQVLDGTAPKVTALTPTEAVIGQSVQFTVKGQGLTPAVLIIEGVQECSGRSPNAEGFTQTCTLGGSAGTRTVRVQLPGQKLVDLRRIQALPAAPAPVGIGKVPHTGITAQQCYKKGSDALVACNSVEAIALSGPGKQDGMRGHINTMSYSEVPGFARTECVKDNLTGLMWEGKTNDGGLRDGSKRYTNYADGRAGSALDYVNQVNAQGLCGHHDWRLPSVDELHSLVDFSKSHPGPTIDTAWFPNTPGATFWSGMLYAGYSANAWFVNFILGGAGYDSTRDRSIAVRLVRASQ